MFRRFTREVQRNLHVVFTMNPASADFDDRAATSPALFNRCVVDWFGDWSDKVLSQVGYEFTENLDLDNGLDYNVTSKAQIFANDEDWLIRRNSLTGEEKSLDCTCGCSSVALSRRFSNTQISKQVRNMSQS